MIAQAVEVLRAGREVRVLEIAQAAGVSHSLIYRHFPDGGREELIAEAYARMFRAHVDEDLETLAGFTSDPDELHAQFTALFIDVLSTDRAAHRWARLEALAQGRLNPYIEARINATKIELVRELAERLRTSSTWDIEVTKLLAYATLMLSLPLGLTALAEPHATTAERAAIADVWATMAIATADALRGEGGSPFVH